MSALIDPEDAAFAREMAAAMNAPRLSAQELVAKQRIDARGQLDEADLIIANCAALEIRAREEARNEKAKKLSDHAAREQADLARDAATVERLEAALVEAQASFALNAQAFKDGRRAIETDADAELQSRLRDIQAEMDAAKLAKAAAEAMLGASAQVIGGAA